MYVCVRRRFCCQSSQSAELMYQHVTCICTCNYTRTCIQNFNHAKLQNSHQIKKKNQGDIICIYIYIVKYAGFHNILRVLKCCPTLSRHRSTHKRHGHSEAGSDTDTYLFRIRTATSDPRLQYIFHARGHLYLAYCGLQDTWEF